MKSPFHIDWTDLETVKAYAQELANKFRVGQVVIKHPDRPNYNITFTSRVDRYRPEWVVYQSV